VDAFQIPAWVDPSNRFLIPILAPQVLTLLDSLLVVFLIGLAGRHQPDELREWWSRVGAWLCILGLAGLGLAGIAISGPVIMFFLRDQVGLAIATGSIWALATGAGVLLGRSPSTSGNGKSKRPIVARLLPLTPVIFVAGFLILVSNSRVNGSIHCARRRQ
jgi:hypothetical protein